MLFSLNNIIFVIEIKIIINTKKHTFMKKFLKTIKPLVVETVTYVSNFIKVAAIIISLIGFFAITMALASVLLKIMLGAIVTL